MVLPRVVTTLHLPPPQLALLREHAEVTTPSYFCKSQLSKTKYTNILLEIKKTFNVIWGGVLGKDAIEVDHHKSASTRWFCQRASGRSQKRNCMNWCLVLRYIWVFALATQPALFLRISETNNDSWWPNNSYVLMLTRLNSQGILCTSSDKVDDALLQAAGWKNKVFQTVAILANHEKVGTCRNQTRRFPCCVLSVLSTNETLRTNKLSRATKQNQHWKESYKW